MRDPRKQPLPGDVLTRLGCTRTVVEIKKNTRGTVTHVVYGHPTNKTPEIEITISGWRSWANNDAMIVFQASVV